MTPHDFFPRPRRLALAAVIFALLSCSFVTGELSCTSTAPAKLAAGCTLNTDCTTPLVCAFQVCHQQCVSSRDCPATERCIKSNVTDTVPPLDVCQLSTEAACSYTSQCPDPEVCAADGQCRDQCAADRDCIELQVCVTGVCADPSETTSNGESLKNVPDAGVGVTCERNSDCGDAGLVCLQGLCQLQCVADINCVPRRGLGALVWRTCV